MVNVGAMIVDLAARTLKRGHSRRFDHNMKRNRKGFTLIELLIVVAIIGIIVAIAIPNLLNAIQRAKQKRTMGDMRTIGTAAEAYAVDNNRYPAAAGYTLPTGLSYPTGTTSAIVAAVVPTYIKLVPVKDGWGGPFLYGPGNNNQDYVIASYGKNGTSDGLVGGPTTDFNMDIVFVDGQFVQFPDGIQK
jgi:type II secretion system protein G